MASLSTDARTKFNALRGEVSQNFTAQPSTGQDLHENIPTNTDFLGRINMTPVDQLKGQKVMMGLNGSVTSRTDTNSADRVAKSALSLHANEYELSFTESDVALPFATIDAWAKFKDFQKRYNAAVKKQIDLDRIKIGFHGTHVAAQTDRVAYPMLQDVNKGWLQQARELVPAQVMSEGGQVAGKVVLGSTGDFANLDSLVLGLAQLIEPEYREAGDLIAIIGRDLLTADKTRLYAAQGDKPTEKERIEAVSVSATYGGLLSYSVPFFPANAVLVTSWDNLSIYWQESSWRRHLIDNPNRSRAEDFNSRNEGYVIEQLEKLAFAENVEYQA